MKIERNTRPAKLGERRFSVWTVKNGRWIASFTELAEALDCALDVEHEIGTVGEWMTEVVETMRSPSRPLFIAKYSPDGNRFPLSDGRSHSTRN